MEIITDYLITRNRPYQPMKPKSVTIHETGNAKVGADAMANRNYFQTTTRQVSAHWVVDDTQAVQCIPEGEVAWHAGPEANESSISIEICINEDADHSLVYANAVQLTCEILNRWNLDETDLKTHQMWTGKNCPANMLRENRWNTFIDDVKKNLGFRLSLEGAIFPVILIEGKSYIAVRDVLEHLGYTVDWNNGHPVKAMRKEES